MKRILFTALAIALISPAFSQGLYKAPFGIQTYSFRNSFPKGVAQTLDTIKSFGITELEANAPGNMSNEEFRKLCDDRGLKIPSTGAGYDELVRPYEDREAGQNPWIIIRDVRVDTA